MDSFSIIQHFFSRMRCHYCTSHFDPEGVQLVKEDKGVYVVDVQCVQCDRKAGMAMVSVEGSERVKGARRSKRFKDPELTEEELERLSVFEPIDYDDVLDAHSFFQGLGSDWMKHLPSQPLEAWDVSVPEETQTA